MLNKIITLGDKIDITKTNDFDASEKDKTVYLSQVLEVYDAHTLKIAAPIDSGKIIPLEINKDYYLCFYAKKGLYRCKGRITNREKTNNQHTMTVMLITKLEKFQRRQFFRLNCVMTFQYKHDKDKGQWREGLIVDLSGGGLRFTTEGKLNKDQPIICQLELDYQSEKTVIQILGNILTIDKVANEANKYEYRVEFSEINTEDRELIIKYIFEEERRRRKREKGMI